MAKFDKTRLDELAEKLMRQERNRLESEAQALISMGFTKEELIIAQRGQEPGYVTVKPNTEP